MPNWCYQQVITRNREHYDILVDRILDNKGEVDFNRLAPLPRFLEFGPDHIKLTECVKVIAYALTEGKPSCYGDILEKIRKIVPEVKTQTNWQGTGTIPTRIIEYITEETKNNKNIKQEVEEVTKNHSTGLTIKDLAELLIKRIVSTGYFDGNEWRLNNWGTRGNAQKTSAHFGTSCGEIYFETPWLPAYPIYVAMSSLLPKNAELFVEYSEEQFNETAGELIVSNGRVIAQNEPYPEDKDLFKIAARMQDIDQKYFRWSEEAGGIVSIEYDEELFKETVPLSPEDLLDTPIWKRFNS